jgi:hypothetical protein
MMGPVKYKRPRMFKTDQLKKIIWTVTTNLLTIGNWRVFNARSTEKAIKSSRHDQLENTIKSSRQDQMKKTIQNQLENSIESSISSIERQLKVQNCCFLLEREKLRIRDFESHDNWYY